MPGPRVLLVEDEPSLRQLLARYLNRLEFTVEEAGSAEEALAKPASQFDLLIIDLTLPGMQGDELMLRVLESSPEPRVLLSSGYPYDMSGHRAKYRDRCSFLQKPYLPKQLGEELKKLLSGGAARPVTG